MKNWLKGIKQYPDYWTIQAPSMEDVSSRGNYKRLLDETLPSEWSLVATGAKVQITKRIEHLSRMFKREFQYDFCYSYLEGVKDTDRIYILSSCGRGGPKAMIGVVFMKYCPQMWKEDELNGWQLDYAYIHPYERNHGHLGRLWPILLREYPGFTINPPLSKAMKAFVNKHGGLPNPKQAELTSS